MRRGWAAVLAAVGLVLVISGARLAVRPEHEGRLLIDNDPESFVFGMHCAPGAGVVVTGTGGTAFVEPSGRRTQLPWDLHDRLRYGDLDVGPAHLLHERLLVDLKTGEARELVLPEGFGRARLAWPFVYGVQDAMVVRLRIDGAVPDAPDVGAPEAVEPAGALAPGTVLHAAWPDGFLSGNGTTWAFVPVGGAARPLDWPAGARPASPSGLLAEAPVFARAGDLLLAALEGPRPQVAAFDLSTGAQAWVRAVPVRPGEEAFGIGAHGARWVVTRSGWSEEDAFRYDSGFVVGSLDGRILEEHRIEGWLPGIGDAATCPLREGVVFLQHGEVRLWNERTERLPVLVIGAGVATLGTGVALAVVHVRRAARGEAPVGAGLLRRGRCRSCGKRMAEVGFCVRCGR